MERKDENMAKLDSIQEKLKRVDEMLLRLNDIDEDSDDAVERYAKGLALAMALQDEAKEELERFVGLESWEWRVESGEFFSCWRYSC